MPNKNNYMVVNDSEILKSFPSLSEAEETYRLENLRAMGVVFEDESFNSHPKWATHLQDENWDDEPTIRCPPSFNIPFTFENFPMTYSYLITLVIMMTLGLLWAFKVF